MTISTNLAQRLLYALTDQSAANEVIGLLTNDSNWVNGNLTIPGLLFESVTDNITAHSGGGQSLATALTTELNRVATVAAIGDSVKLPASVAGLTVYVLNNGANSMQVYGAGADTIDDVAAATGVAQMKGSVTLYTCVTAGKWYSNGIGTGYSGSLPTVSYTDAITAHAGGGQGSATPLTTILNRVTVVATGGDSVLLPVAAPGLQILVTNASAATSMNVFPSTGDQINALGANAAFALTGTKSAQFNCTVAGQWHSLLTA